MAQNGYISFGKLFGGLILVGGTSIITSIVNFPISFTKKCVYFNSYILNTANNTSADYTMQVRILELLKATLILQEMENNNSGYREGFIWFALGI